MMLTTEPIMEAIIKDKRISFQPRNRPAAAISFISPPPMPPLLRNAISSKIILTAKKPMMCSQMPLPDKKIDMMPQTKMMMTSSSGMI